MKAVCLLGAAALAGMGASASSGRETDVRLALTLTASISKDWTYSSTRAEENCRVKTTGNGARQTTIRSRRRTIVSARRVGSRILFSPAAVRFLAGVVTEEGSKNEYASCDGKITHFDCIRFRRQFGKKAARLSSPRTGVLRFRRVTGLPRVNRTSCPGEPAQIRAEEPGLHSVPGRLREQVVLDRSFRRFVSTGDLRRTVRLAGATPGTVRERVRWKLEFRPA